MLHSTTCHGKKYTFLNWAAFFATTHKYYMYFWSYGVFFISIVQWADIYIYNIADDLGLDIVRDGLNNNAR